MKALQIFAPGEARFVETPKPSPQPGEALIRPVKLSLCASDIWMWRYSPIENFPYPAGSSGHEIVGIVEEINGDLPGMQVGDMTLAIYPAQLGMAEYFVAEFKNVLPVPAGILPEHLVQAQQLGTVIFACKQLPNIVGKSVAVIGQGSAGLWWNTMLNRMGAAEVIGIDLQAHRVKAGLQFGATHTIHNKSADPVPSLKAILDGRLPDVVVEAAGLNESINLAFDIVKEDGFVLQFGVPHEQSFVINYSEIFRKCITLKAIVNASAEPGHTSTLAALQMIAKAEVDASAVITHHFPFDQVLEAYDLQRTRDEGAIKIVIDMP
ncbi:MAG: L-iditol 2-dehydrogenase [Cellvibrionaceae bacterium]|jgi:L-iditol 2-dehydrogenase